MTRNYTEKCGVNLIFLASFPCDSVSFRGYDFSSPSAPGWRRLQPGCHRAGSFLLLSEEPREQLGIPISPVEAVVAIVGVLGILRGAARFLQRRDHLARRLDRLDVVLDAVEDPDRHARELRRSVRVAPAADGDR